MNFPVHYTNNKYNGMMTECSKMEEAI